MPSRTRPASNEAESGADSATPRRVRARCALCLAAATPLALVLANPAEAGCETTGVGDPDAIVSVDCSGAIDQYQHRITEQVSHEFRFHDLTQPIKGKPDDPAWGLFQDPAVAVYQFIDLRTYPILFDFDGGREGVDAAGHGIVLSARGEDGSKPIYVGNHWGYDGSNGAFPRRADVTLPSGVVTSRFDPDYPTRTDALRAAVLLEFIGGDGGEGGDATGSGATGGEGGTGGGEMIPDSAIVATLGEALTVTSVNGIGVAIQSIAGDGGRGGDANTGFFDGSATGGMGGAGGEGGRIEVTSDATIEADNIGMLVRSLGGAGGDGGNGDGFWNGRGGAAAGGGDGGEVTLTLGGSVTVTRGAPGVLVQSVGGFAGDGGNARGLVSYGSSAESAGNGGALIVTVKDGFQVETGGKSNHRAAPGLLLQSIGGGGGNAGTASGGWVLGGSGSAGGNGGTITLDAPAATITTHVFDSDGVVAASIGGGGGSANVNDGIVTYGGTGGSGGNGGAVTARLGGDVTTYGAFSDAVLLQSIGGGGGSGATSRSRSLVSAVAIGGTGGSGGDGGRVVFSDPEGAPPATIATSGTGSKGISAMSIGGGGGTGGNAAAGAFSYRLDFTLGVAGDGGAGGSGGKVEVDTAASIVTAGDQATAISAMSVGGGGGDTGQVATMAASALSKVSFAFELGAEAGKGGSAKAVTVGASGDLATAGHMADAILAQSIGGGGGTSRSSTGGSLGLGSLLTLGADFGTSGGSGGHGRAVSVEQSGTIATEGDGSRAIVAQSIGGGGGDASAVAILDAMSLGAMAFAMGAEGAKGGTGGAVEVTATGDLSTAGDAASAILAQSIAGGGGAAGTVIRGRAGGALSLNFAMGGASGDGADAGTVDVLATGTVATAGVLSHAVVAQSIAQGGGLSGTVISPYGFGQGDIDIDVGGTQVSSGKSGNGDIVTINASGVVETHGAGALGLVAQSIGAGGGLSGIDVAETEGNDIQIDLGSGRLTTGTGGPVRLSLEDGASVTTHGDLAPALLAQSVGGGGGAAILDLDGGAVDTMVVGLGNAEGNGSDATLARGKAVTVTSAGTISTAGTQAYGILAQSVGGGGGLVLATDSTASAIMRIGGTQKASGNGGTVNVTNAGTIVTSGAQAAGIVAQSVGGGGGIGPNAMLAFDAAAPQLNVGTDVGKAAHGFAAVNHRTYGSASAVDVRSGSITTTGTAAHGVLAQSVGAGGGLGAILSGGSNGQVVAAMAGSVGTKGLGRQVAVTVDGAIDVSGYAAHGVIAQSAGGDSGSGNVLVTVNGSIDATGENGRGILAQSSAVQKIGRSEIVVAEGGSVTAGADARAALLVMDGVDNQITNDGSIVKAGGWSRSSDENYAIIVQDGSAQVVNNGLVSGAISIPTLLGFDNTAQGVVEFGPDNDWNRGQFRNAGTITAGERGKIRSVNISGALHQTAGGTILVDHELGDAADVAARADHIEASITTLYGSVSTNIVGVSLVEDGSDGQVDFFRVRTDQLSTVDLKAEDTATIDYEIVERSDGQSGTIYSLAYSVDYTPWETESAESESAESESAESVTTMATVATGRTATVSGTASEAETATETAVPASANLTNAGRFGSYLGELVAARVAERQAIAAGRLPLDGGQYGFVEDLMVYVLGIEDIASLVDNYELMVPNVHNAPLDANMLSSIAFADALLSCPDPVAGDGVTGIAEDGTCAWAQLQANHLNRGATRQTLGYEETSFGLSAGVQAEIADGWVAGFGLSYENASLSADNLRSGTGDRFQAGLVVEKHMDQWTFAAGITGGFGVYDIDRLTRTPAGLRSASSHSTIGIASVHGRIARTFAFDDLYVEPRLDAGLHYQWRPGFSENGAGAYGVRFSDYDEMAFTFNPQVEVGGNVALGAASARLFARAGILGVAGDERALEATFAAVPEGGPTLSVSDDPDHFFGKLGVGIDATIAEQWNLKLEGKTLLGDDQQVFSASARLNYRF